MRRRCSTAVLAVGICLTLGASACSSNRYVDPGDAAAVPDQSYAATAQTQEFDADMKKLNDALISGRSVKGTVFKNGSFGSKSSSFEWDVLRVGNDKPSIFVRSRVPSKFAGDNLDTLHTAGSPYDYHLLGGDYSVLATTPWVRVPTYYHDPLNVCLITGYQTICDMQDTVTLTAKEGVKAAKRVSHNADGSLTLITGVTLRSMLVYNFLLNIPKSISSQFTKDMLDYQLSARFTIDTDGNLQFAEIVGVVPGKTDLVVQVGYQVTGQPQQSDVPQLPPASQVTNLSQAVYSRRLKAVARA